MKTRIVLKRRRSKKPEKLVDTLVNGAVLSEWLPLWVTPDVRFQFGGSGGYTKYHRIACYKHATIPNKIRLAAEVWFDPNRTWNVLTSQILDARLVSAMANMFAENPVEVRVGKKTGKPLRSWIEPKPSLDKPDEPKQLAFVDVPQLKFGIVEKHGFGIAEKPVKKGFGIAEEKLVKRGFGIVDPPKRRFGI